MIPEYMSSIQYGLPKTTPRGEENGDNNGKMGYNSTVINVYVVDMQVNVVTSDLHRQVS